MAVSMRTLFGGYGMMLLYILSWNASSIGVQLLERKVPDFQLGAARYVGTALCAALLICCQRPDITIPRKLWGYLVLYALSSLGCLIFLFAAASILPMSHAGCLPGIATIIAVTVISKLAYNEHISIFTVLAITGSTLGTVLLVQPWEALIDGFIPGFVNTKRDSAFVNCMGNCSSVVQESSASYGLWMPVIGYISLALAGIFDAGYMLTGGVSLKRVNPAVLVFYASMIDIVLCGLFSVYLEEAVWITDPYPLCLVVLHMVGSAGAMFSETTACQIIKPTHVAIIKTLRTLFSLIPQYTILAAHLHGKKNVLEVLGAILIVCSIMFNEWVSNVDTSPDLQ